MGANPTWYRAVHKPDAPISLKEIINCSMHFNNGYAFIKIEQNNKVTTFN